MKKGKKLLKKEENKVAEESIRSDSGSEEYLASIKRNANIISDHPESEPSPDLGTKVYIVGEEYGEPFIHLTLVNKLEEKGNFGIINRKEGLMTFDLKKAFEQYSLLMDKMVNKKIQELEIAKMQKAQMPQSIEEFIILDMLHNNSFKIKN